MDGRFTTSRYYADTVPAWVNEFNARDLISRYRGKEWTLLLPESEYPEPDSVPFENGGRNFVFPHRISSEVRAAGSELPEFPWMDEVTVEFALEGVNQLQLGLGPSTDVLSVSLSTTDAVGHRYGPDSREIHDIVLRVDRVLGVLMDSLFRMRDSTRIVFALSADHGVTPIPEAPLGNLPQRDRVNSRRVLDSVRSGLVARGLENDALTLETGIVMLDTPRLTAAGINADSVVALVRDLFLEDEGVRRVDRVDQLASLVASGDSIARRWYNSIPPDLNAVLTVTLQPYYYWSSRSPTHGTPYNLDAGVPIIFMGPTVKPGRYERAIRTVDIAPTLAAIAGVRPTEDIDGTVVTEIIGAPTGLAPRVRRR